MKWSFLYAAFCKTHKTHDKMFELYGSNILENSKLWNIFNGYLYANFYQTSRRGAAEWHWAHLISYLSEKSLHIHYAQSLMIMCFIPISDQYKYNVINADLLRKQANTENVENSFDISKRWRKEGPWKFVNTPIFILELSDAFAFVKSIQ